MAATVAGMGGRALLEPWIDGVPFVFAFPAVVVASVWGGLWTGLLTAALCAIWFVIPAAPGPTAAISTGLFESALFFCTAGSIAVLVSRKAARSFFVTGHEPAGTPEAEAEASTVFWLRAAVVFSVLLPWALFAIVALYSHGTTIQGAQRRVERIAAIANEHALKLFDTTEVLIRQASLLTQDMDSAQLRANAPRLHEQLAAMTQGLPQVQSVWILDRDGNALASSRVASPPPLNFAQQPPFTAHRQHTSDQVLVSPPRIGQVTHEMFFDISRSRLSQGAFNGIVLVGLRPEYFTGFYKDLTDSEAGVAVTLVHQDGSVVARWPQPEQPGGRLQGDSPMLGAMAKGESTGRTWARSSVDQKVRIGAFHKVGAYPLYVYAGADEISALRPWRREVVALGGFILPLSLCLALISWQALRRTQRQIELTGELRKEAAERQRAEAALRQAQKLEAMGHLTGGVAHDFNNLLMVVTLNSRLLRQRLGPEQHGALDAIDRAVSAGKNLTRQLLAFSRKQPLLPRRIDFEEVMPALVDLIRPALGSHISATAHVEPGTQAVVLDRGELELAMINLAVNAKDAMPEGGEIRIRVCNDVDFVEVAVSDTGSGMPPEIVERVFEPFFTTKPVGEGTGLGLSQVYAFCTRAGGTARIESKVGVGTTVILRFPAAEHREAGVESELSTLAEGATLSLRVLMVEDNIDVAAATRELLAAAGCTVEHVTQPADALALLEKGMQFDVVLSDIVMPGGMDGLQLAQELAQRWPQLPVVLMSGYARKLSEAEAQDLVVLPKPFGPDLLISTLRRRVRRKTA